MYAFKRMAWCGIWICLSPFLLIAKSGEKHNAEDMVQTVEVTVSGVVTDASDGSTMPGVNIAVKGTTTGTSTDAKGRYELAVSSSADTLVFSFVGYKTQEVPINGRAKIDVALHSQPLQGEKLVVTGYSSQQKKEITGSVSTVDVSDITDVPASNTLSSLQGRVAGLNITRSGTPGGGIRSVTIRGSNTLGSNNPLFIIDGLPVKRGTVNQLNPNDIESMEVLKDASATSIYGSRASNGVVIITTKKPKSGELRINVNSSISLQDYATHRKVTNTRQRGRVRWQAYINDGKDPNTDPQYNFKWHANKEGQAILDKVNVVDFLDKSAQGGIKSANTNWFDIVSRPGIIAQNNISLSAGSDTHSLRISLGRRHNKGIIKYTDFQRLNATVNSNINFFDGKLSLGENIRLMHSKQSPMGSGPGGDVARLAVRAQPILPVRAEDGSFAGPIGAGMSDRMNPLHAAELAKLWNNNINSLSGNIHLNLDLLQNLTFKSNFGLNYNKNEQLRIHPTYQEGFLSNTTNDMSEANSILNDWTWFNTLSYGLNIGKHKTNILVGIEETKSNSTNGSRYREDFILQNKDFFEFDAGTGPLNLSGSETGFNLLSYFSKIEYSYDEKYLATATLRYDGSSRFGQNNRYGFFPAGSVGWRINNERFFRNNVVFLSQLTLRAGFGKTGNQEIGNYASRAIYVPGYGLTEGLERPAGSAYDLDGNDKGTLPSGIVKRQTANPSLRWESTNEINLGMDFGFFEQKMTGSFDYFWRKTEDILVQPPRLAVYGDGSQKWENGATMKNRGWETELNYNNQIGGTLNYQIGITLSHSRDKVTSAPKTVIREYPGNVEKTILGHSISSLFGYVTDGIFKNKEEVSKHAEQPGKAVGRLRYKDINNDGVINSLDQDWIGIANPNIEYGLTVGMTYKNFNLSFFLQGVQGIDLVNQRKNMEIIGTGTVAGENYSIRALDAWTPQNRETDIPALSLDDTNDENRMSNYYVEDASYLKLKNLRLGYILPNIIQQTINMKQAKIFISGSELLTIKTGDFSGPDPENPASYYPLPRTISLGFNLTF